MMMLMKGLVTLLLLVALFDAVESLWYQNEEQCEQTTPLETRPHSVSILEFGAVGDGKTLNTVAFQNAIFYLKSFTDKGGAQLYVPPGKWLTGCFNLTSHLTVFLESGATILASQNYSNWGIVEPLPSYGRGIEVPGARYCSLITGYNLTDVVITGGNGTIDGQGSVWWESFDSHSLNYSRPHLVEFISSTNVVVSNITLLNSPSWNIHPVYCSHVLVQNVTAYSPPDSPQTSGIVPDSCDHVCIATSNISMGHDAIALKSGWDEYGISYSRPTTHVHIKDVRLFSFTGSCLAFGSEMSGGISDVVAERLHIYNSFIGIDVKTSKGRGGYIKDILVSGVKMANVAVAIKVSGDCESHPDDQFDPDALPVVQGITFKDIVGTNITTSGNFSGISESPFTLFCLSNVSFSGVSDLSNSWICSDVSGFSEAVSPEPCPDLQSSLSSTSSSTCFSQSYARNRVAIL